MDEKIYFYEVISFKKPVTKVLFAKIKEDTPAKDLINLLEEMRKYGISCNITKKDRIINGRKKTEIYLVCGSETFAIPLEKHGD